ncbi:FAD:protein FMN transferase [Salipiger sp. P9]|uniref:FAD:protein FMN transferase n=1 Tax=Salipiger pentaromativorans TaxID=2943193 RepID=UPI002156F711|nr:FAD:protein FMN transferase [Salipiger pentaromativorans]MCR8547470.1 FAD:protein FMN transferase [Salipiger pentaromativorans]
MTPLAVRRLVILLGLGLALLYFGAVRAAQPDREHRETLYVFGTLVEIVIFGADEAEARAASAEIGRALQRQHRDWHAWQPGALGDLNAALAAGRGRAVAPPLAALLREGRRLSCLSGGRFDPAIGRLIGLWGFHADTPPEGALPDPAAIDVLRRAAPRMTDLRFDGDRIASVNPTVQLDLGGFAKGAALDAAAAALEAAGIASAVLNAGGDVNVIGRHGARPWRVAIRDPFVWGTVGAISLEPGEVLYTSGNYERFFEQNGARFAHIIDPRSGWPVREIVSVSVLDSSGTRADAAATALAVAGRADWPQVAAAMGVAAVLMIDAEGTLYATPAMAARLEPAGGGFPGPLREVALPHLSAPPECDAY